MGEGQEMTLRQYVDKLEPSHRAWKEFAKLTEQHAVINKLKVAAEALKRTRDSLAASMNPDTFAKFDEVMEPALQGVKDATYSATIARLECEVNVAAGMLSTTGDWASKHPEEALDFIRKTAAEIAAYDSEPQAVEVLMAERTATAFDGPAFSAMPSWLEKALKIGTVRESTVGALDYMTWLVATVDGPAIAAPGHHILRAADGALTVEASLSGDTPAYLGKVEETKDGEKRHIFWATVTYSTRLAACVDVEDGLVGDQLEHLLGKRMKSGHRMARMYGEQVANLFHAPVDVAVDWDHADEMPEWDELKNGKFHIEPDRTASYELVKEAKEESEKPADEASSG